MLFMSIVFAKKTLIFLLLSDAVFDNLYFGTLFCLRVYLSFGTVICELYFTLLWFVFCVF